MPFIFLVLSLGAMVAIGVGLFLWLNGEMAAEAQQLHGDLANGAGRIQSEAALEFAVVAGLLSYGIEDEKSEWFPQAAKKYIPRFYEKWSLGTRFPGLIDTVYVVEGKSGSTIITSYSAPDWEAVTTTDTPPDPVTDLVAREDESGLYRIVSDDDGLALVLPVLRLERRPILLGYIVVVFNLEYFAGEVVTRLFETYLGPGQTYTFNMVFTRSAEVLASSQSLDQFQVEDTELQAADHRVKLTAWIGAESSLLTDVLSAAGEETGAIWQKGLSASFRDLFIRQWFSLPRFVNGSPLGKVAADDLPRDEPQFEGLTLNIRHTSGSIEKAVRITRNRRLAIGYSILASFAIVAVVLFLLYRRARDLSNREHEFVATVTHELKTPISGVSAVADNLAAGIVTDQSQVKEYGKAILDHSRRLKDLIDQVLLYAGLSKPVIGAAEDSIDFDEVVPAIISRASPLLKERLIIHIMEKHYTGDLIAIETILMNLLTNAAKHAGDSATITVNIYRETQRNRGWLVMRVSDTGTGISKKELSRICEPFYRGEISRANQTPGGGLGLSLVSRIVGTYNGTFNIGSPGGRGTTAMVRLPILQHETESS